MHSIAAHVQACNSESDRKTTLHKERASLTEPVDRTENSLRLHPIEKHKRLSVPGA